MPAHSFLSRELRQLPVAWHAQPDKAFFDEAGRQMGISPDLLTSRVFFELPDCTPARDYATFAKAAAESADGDSIVTVALVSQLTFDEAKGPGSAVRAVRHLYDHGFPEDIIRMVILK